MRILCLLFTLTVLASCSAPEEPSRERSEVVDTSAVPRTVSEPEPEGGPLKLSNDQFFAAWGSENYTGHSDLSVEASMWSDSEVIHLVVRVKDDTLVVRDDLLHSDHVEVWLSASRAPMKYIVVTDTSESRSRLFQYKNTANVDSFLAELDNPLFVFSSPDEREGENFRGRVDTTERAQLFWQHSGFQYAIDQLKKGTVEEGYVFDGMVHWGLFADERDAVLYDQERYAIIEAQTDTELVIADHAPDYTVEVSEEGYTIHAQFSPESLGFVPSRGIGHIWYMIDIVDVDHGGRQETILSSSEDREWGGGEHLRSYKFERPIDVELVAGLTWLGAYPSDESVDGAVDIPRFEIPRRFVLTSNGWRGLRDKRKKTSGDSPWSSASFSGESSLPNMDETFFQLEEIGYLAYDGGGYSFEVLKLPGIDHNDRSEDQLTINGVEVEKGYGGPYEILSFFTFPDSSAGFIQARWGYEWGYCRPTGLCGCNIKDDVELVRVDSVGGLTTKNLVTVDQCGPNMIMEKDTLTAFQLEDDDWVRTGDITWQEAGRQVAFNFEKIQVVFSWDEKGEQVQYDLKSNVEE